MACGRAASRVDRCTIAPGVPVIGVFDDDLAGGPVDLIEVKGPPFGDHGSLQG